MEEWVDKLKVDDVWEEVDVIIIVFVYFCYWIIIICVKENK